MDRKSLVILTTSLLLLMGVYWGSNRMFPPTPLPPETNQLSTNALAPLSNAPAEDLNARTDAAPMAAPTPSRVTLSTNSGPEKTLVVENKDARYTFTSRGGGLRLVELKQYPATVECRKQTSGMTNQYARLNATAPEPILAILGSEAVEGDGQFTLSEIDGGVRAEKTLTNGLHLVKDFRLSTNYLIKTTVRFENRAAQPLALPAQEWIVGTAAPMGLHDESLTMGFEWYNGSSAERIDQAWFANRALGCLPGNPRHAYGPAGNSNVVWAAVHNQFFAVIVVPGQSAPGVVGRPVTLPGATPAEMANDSKAIAHPTGYEAALSYPAQQLGPNQSVERAFNIYAGPKEYNTLSHLSNNLDLVMGFGGFFGFFAKALLLSMNGLHAMALPYSLTIIVITVIIKLVFWPLTKASTRSMKRMQELQPQMKALQEKYKDDPRKMNMKLMEFMRENKVSPLGGCLPMLLQIPVFFGFYRMLQSAIELRGARFLWACDLSQPDTLWVIPGLNFPVNPLPLIMGATMLWQARLTPASPGMDPVQQKMMKYMPLMFMFFLYNFSAGLTLYWTVQNLLTIAQMKLTRSSDRPASPAHNGGAAAPRGPLPKKKK